MTTIILLAAGAARRFGAQKLLATLPSGERVIDATLRALKGQNAKIVAVVRAEDDLASALRAASCEVIINPQANDGMGTSIAAGVAASDEAEGWLIALSDMPFVNAETINAIIQLGKTSNHIITPIYQGARGHPVYFPAWTKQELLALTGDTGARALLARHASRVKPFLTDDSGVTQDIDTPGDLARCR